MACFAAVNKTTSANTLRSSKISLCLSNSYWTQQYCRISCLKLIYSCFCTGSVAPQPKYHAPEMLKTFYTFEYLRSKSRVTAHAKNGQYTSIADIPSLCKSGQYFDGIALA